MKFTALTLGISLSLITSQILFANVSETQNTKNSTTQKSQNSDRQKSSNVLILADADDTQNTQADTATTQATTSQAKTMKLNAIVTSATGFDLPLKDEPKNIMVLDKDEITNKGYQSLDQALQYSPLLTFTNSGFGNNIDLRGQGPDANRAVKVLVNRVPISLLDTSHGVPPYNNIDIEDIESIEVIPGGGAVVYGNGTRGGVINIVTKMPSRDFARVVLKGYSGEKLGLQGGSASLAYGKKVSDNLFLRADVSGGYNGGVRNAKANVTGYTNEAFINDNVTNIYAAFQTIYQFNEDSKLDFNINYSHLWTNYPQRRLTMANKSQSTIESERNNPSTYTIKTQTDAVQTSLNYTQRFSESLDFDAILFYQFSKLKYTQDAYRGSSTNPSGPFTSYGSDGKAGFFNQGGGLNLKVKWKTDSNTLIAGLDNIIEYSNRTNYMDHSPAGNPAILRYTMDIRNNATKLSNSIYALDTYNFTKSFSFGGGVRLEYSNYWTTNTQQSTYAGVAGQRFPNQNYTFDYHTQRFGYAVELTPNFKYSDTGNVYAKAELGFISPSAYQMINAVGSTSATTLNPNTANGIKPEQYITGEIGVKDEIILDSISLFGSATIFYTHTFDEIYVNNISHGTAYSYGNLGQTQRAGIELISTQKFFDTSWLRLSESVSAMYTNILKTNVATAHLQGKMVPYVPWLKATINLEADVFKTDSMFLTLFWNNAYYSQSIDTSTNEFSALDGNGQNGSTTIQASSHLMNKGGYFLSDVGLLFGISNFKVNLGVRNLFDSWYATYQKYPNYIPALGRSYYAELRYSF